MKRRKTRNAVARALRSPRFGKCVARNDKTYRRKSRAAP